MQRRWRSWKRPAPLFLFPEVTHHDTGGHQKYGGKQKSQAGNQNAPIAKCKAWEKKFAQGKFVIFRYHQNQKANTTGQREMTARASPARNDMIEAISRDTARFARFTSPR